MASYNNKENSSTPKVEDAVQNEYIIEDLFKVEQEFGINFHSLYEFPNKYK